MLAVFLSFRASAHTGVGIPRIERKYNEKWQESFGDCQEVNCPKGARDATLGCTICGLVRNDTSFLFRYKQQFTQYRSQKFHFHLVDKRAKICYIVWYYIMTVL